MQLTRRLLRFLIQQPLVLRNNVFPKIRHPHLPAHHAFQVSVKLFGLAQVHHIVYGLCGKVVFDPLFPVVLTLDLSLFVAGLQLGMALEEVGQSAANLTGDLGQVIASLFQVLVDGNAPLYAFIGTLAKCECRDWINFYLYLKITTYTPGASIGDPAAVAVTTVKAAAVGLVDGDPKQLIAPPGVAVLVASIA